MKGLIALLVLGVVFSARAEQSSNKTCPTGEEDPEIDVLLSHESDCSKFYKCSHGVKVEHDCPEGLHFNNKTNECDWPANVNCNDGENGNGGGEENGDDKDNLCPSVTEDPDDDILFPHESDCSKFYKCSHGDKYEQDCPEDLHFNNATKACDWPVNAQCEGDNNNIGNGNGTNIIGENFLCPSTEEDPDEDILFPHESDCGKFYKCTHGEAKLQDCPEGLHYNPKVRYCDWPENTNCTNNGTLTPAEHKQQLLPHESDCTKFYLIFNGVSFEYNCPSGLYFNNDIEVCDYQSNVECHNKEISKNKRS